MHIKQTHIATTQPNLLNEHVYQTHGLKRNNKQRNANTRYKKLPEQWVIQGL